MARYLTEQGLACDAQDPQRLLWYGLCTFWTDNWDALSRAARHIPCCPHCGSPGFQITAEKWFAGAARFDAEHPGYLKFLEDNKERCHGRRVTIMQLFDSRDTQSQ